MKKLLLLIVGIAISLSAWSQVQRSETILKEWDFRRGHDVEATEGWQSVNVPHDWAIYGPFDRSHDLQTVAVGGQGVKKSKINLSVN